VQTVLQEQPFSGHVSVVRGRRGDLVKLLWWDGDGLCLICQAAEAQPCLYHDDPDLRSIWTEIYMTA
jgi:hypothetical protein